MNEYRELTKNIHAPKSLQRQVLAAADRGTTRSGSRRGRVFLRAAACTACALALLLGTWTLRRETPAGTGEEGPVVLNYSFGLTAHAADSAVNGGIIFRWENGSGSFRVAGGDIREITLAVVGGVLLRNGEPAANPLTEAFAPETVYGLAAENGDVGSLDGAVLTMTAVFADGTSESRSYPLSAEMLRTFRNADGSEVLVPTLAGDDGGTVAALYTTGADSRWLLWPVTGSNTVSLSQSYGGRVPPGGGEPVFHEGIDIPGDRGADIAASAAGTVIEAGFDPERGNYLVLDHGDGLTTLYGQCQELLAAEGDRVEAGQVIALLGSTGMSTGPHLHFEVRRNGTPENPVAYFDSAVRDTLRAE